MKLVKSVIIISLYSVLLGNASAALNVTPGGTANQFWNCLFPKPLPSGVTINSVTYTGYNTATGCYSNMPPINGIQPNDGLLMTSGEASLAIGPNNASGSGYGNNAAGDADLKALIGDTTYDAAALKINFTIDTSVHGISFDFVFGSDEFPEYVGKFNDVFGAFLDGTNISFDSTGKFISVNNNFFKIDNQDNHINLQMDGFTPLLRSSAPLTAGTHTLKFAIADALDHVLDSDVFLSNFQFSCSDTGTHPVTEVIILNPGIDTNLVGTIDTLTANVQNISGVPIAGRKVIFEILGGPHAGIKDSSITNSSGNALFIYTGIAVGRDTIVATMHDLFGTLVYSNNAYHVWKQESSFPIADAGPDQTLFASAACDALISLDGSGSTNPGNGTIVSYKWEGSFVGSPVIATSPITSITLQSGIYEIILTVTNNEGKTDLDTTMVSITDNMPPAVPTLLTLQGDCSISASYPTTTDNCSGTITGSTNDPLIYSTQGTYTIHWTFTDMAGNISTQTQTVVVADVTKPDPVQSTLPTLTGECSYTITDYPTATDNCSATPITGVPSATNFTTLGNHTVTWTYTDSVGNSTTQTQTVVIADVTKPVPVQSTLLPLTGECSYTITEADYPTATDNCSATPITGVPSGTFFNTLGDNTVTWTYTDAAGNSSTQTQTVTIVDVTKPVPVQSTLLPLTGECSYTITSYPTATDNCSATLITGVPSATNITTLGENTVTWTYTDAAGNSSTQAQTVIIYDVTSPVVSVSADTTVRIPATQSSAFVLVKSATATDNCVSNPVVTAYRSDGKPLDSAYTAGLTTILWKTCDKANNCDSAEQKVTLIINKPPVLAAISDTTIDEGNTLGIHLTATDPDGGAPHISATGLPAGATVTDSANGSGLFHWNTGCNDHGLYTVNIRASDGVDSVQQQFKITVRDVNFPAKFNLVNDTSTLENQQFTLVVRTEDCDINKPSVKIISMPLGSTFKDNGDGTGTFSWLPKCDQNGYYMLIFELNDGGNILRDTMILVINDVNCYDPEITLSENNIVTGINLPVTVAIHVTDLDKTVSKLKAQDLPDGAQFTVDGNGNAVFKWTPDRIGIFTPKIIAIDGADSTVQVDTTITINVENQNFSSPAFLPCADTIIDENQQLILSLSASDPDGTIPVITAITLPDGAILTDNSNGNANVSWRPGCTSHGNYLVVARATDGTFSDTINVNITVREQNCPPVINPIHDKNVALNSILRFTVNATDPDEDGTIPKLSVESDLTGYSFITDGNGNGTVTWNATATGTFTATFYASDGFLNDTEKVTIYVNQSGSLAITTVPKGATIYADPSITAPGMLLGTDSVTWTGGMGTWWFRAEAPGYRPAVFTGKVNANTTSAITVTLKPTIPLMFTPPEEIKVGSGGAIANNASIAFVDYDNDGIQDLSVAHGKTVMIYIGNDTTKGLSYVTPGISITIPSGFDSVIAHTYCNWNNDGKYECIFSLKNGKVFVTEFDNEALITVSELLSRPGEILYPGVIDFNRDARKDLLVLSVSKGLFAYLNNGTDKFPTLDSILSIADGASSTILSGNPLFWDVDGNGWNDVVAMSGNSMKIFNNSNDSTLRHLGNGDDLNAGGQRINSGITSATLLMHQNDLPALVVLNNGKALVYRMHLSGDVSGDGVVNIFDISKISKAWELTDIQVEWNPLLNLKLSAPGEHEVIDIKDISKAAKSWELQE